MKKSFLTLISILVLGASAQAQIVITEIMYNPPESGTDSLEYFELYNKTNNAVNVAGWNFTQGVAFTFPTGATIAAGQYIVIAKYSAHFQSKFGFPPTYEWDVNGALTNTGEDIELRDAAGSVIDYVDYKPTAPWPTTAAGFGPSIVLCDVNADNNDGANWLACTTGTGVIINNYELFGNPGAPSACPSGILANDDQFQVASGQTSNLHVANNDYILDPAAALVTVIGNPAHGTTVVNPDNSIAYTPANGYCGTDALTYKICDQSGCDTADVSIEVLCYPAYTIPQVTSINTTTGVADSVGVQCELTANVYGVNLRPGGIQITIIDNGNNGIAPFRATGSFGYTPQEGDKVTVRGTIGQFNGLVQIAVDTMFKVSSNNPLVTPLVVVAPAENTESKLIKINNLHLVDPAQWATGVGTGFNAYAVSDDHLQDTILIRIDNDVQLFNEPAPSGSFNLVGIGSQYDSSDPYTTGYQIQPRYNADVQAIVSTKQADFSDFIRILPNPVTEYIQVQNEKPIDVLRIYSADGRMVSSRSNIHGGTLIDVSDLKVGVYLISFEKAGAVWTTRFVKI